MCKSQIVVYKHFECKSKAETIVPDIIIIEYSLITRGFPWIVFCQ